jgi:hypothetical protein
MSNVQDKQFVFVCGTGRSGTSILTRVLNGHPLICIGLERFKFIIAREGRAEAELSPSLFEKERFFAFAGEDTNVNPEVNSGYSPFYDAMQRKYATASHVGDKVPHLFVHYDLIGRRFPGAIFLYMLRNIDEVAASWNRRAANPADTGWASAQDYRKAVEWWNRGNRESLAFARRGGNVAVVEFEKFAAADESYFSTILERLQLTSDPAATAAYRKAMASWRTRVRPPDVEKEGQAAFIRENADLSTPDQLIRDYGLRLHAASASRARGSGSAG